MLWSYQSNEHSKKSKLCSHSQVHSPCERSDAKARTASSESQSMSETAAVPVPRGGTRRRTRPSGSPVGLRERRERRRVVVDCNFRYVNFTVNKRTQKKRLVLAACVRVKRWLLCEEILKATRLGRVSAGWFVRGHGPSATMMVGTCVFPDVKIKIHSQMFQWPSASVASIQLPLPALTTRALLDVATRC